MKKKVLLLSTNRATVPYPVPPLGLACLYHRLKHNYKVRLIDGFGLSRNDILTTLREFQPDYVGISIRNIDNMVREGGSSFIPEIIDQFIAPVQNCYNGPLILGGSGFTIFPRELMRLSRADFGITGEAEESLPALLTCLEEGGDPLLIPGVVAAQASVEKQNRATEHLNLSSPFQAGLDQLLDYSYYNDRGAYPIQTKRGCVHHCIYCSYPALEGRKYRRRNISHVVDEIEATSRRMGRPDVTFEFVDSTFNDPPGHAEAICREIVARGIKVRLRTMGMNPANVTDVLLTLMRQAGFAQIDVTPDTASPGMLKRMGKNFTLDHLIRAAESIRRNRMPTMWFFIFGGPGENEETIRETFDFIDRNIDPDDMVHITEGLRIYPHTALHRVAIEEGVVEPDAALLEPAFYVSRELENGKLEQIISLELKTRPNCIRITDTKPSPELIKAAIKERAEKGLNEPLFRTLLRLKRQILS